MMTEQEHAIAVGRPTKLLVAAAALVLVLVAVLLMVAPRADAIVNSVGIPNPAGPLTKITLGEDLACQANYLGDATAEFFPPDKYPGDCGTFVMVDPPIAPGVFYAPDMTTAGHGGSAAAAIGPFTKYTYVSQSGVLGSGSSATPFKVTTTVNAGAPPGGTKIVQDDVYVIGDQFFTTSTTFTNNDGSTHNYRMWRAVDCFLGETDAGYGWADPPGNFAKIACTQYPNNQPAGRFEMLVPVTEGSHYMEDVYSQVWTTIGQHVALPDTVHEYGAPPCTKPPAPPPNPPCSSEDNGMGLSWDFQLAPGQSKTIVSILTMSPGAPPNQPPTASIVVDQPPPTCQDSRVLFSGLFNDPDGAIANVHWDFGDGQSYDEASVGHTYAAAGIYTVTVTVTDNQGSTASAFTTVTAVADTNCCPTLNPLFDHEIIEGQFVRFFPFASDWEADPLTYSLTPELPQGATFDPNSGYFFWRTLDGDAGTYELYLKVTDGMDHTGMPACDDTQPVDIKVTPKIPGTPVIDSDLDGLQDIADNCPGVPNLSQSDVDHDGIGDSCQGPAAATIPTPPPTVGVVTPTDRDGDSFPDGVDNCPGIGNNDQVDFDHDRIGDVCDADLDGDGIAQSAPLGSKLDNCPLVTNPDQRDDGGLGVGNACRAAQAQAEGAGGESAPAGVPAGDSFGAPPSQSPVWIFGSAVAVAAVLVAVGTIVWGIKRRE